MLNRGILPQPIDDHLDLYQISLDYLYHVSSSSPDRTEWLSTLPYQTLLHQVGYQAPDFISPTNFAYTSYWQSYFFSANQAHVLPYIIHPPSPAEPTKEIARQLLGIHPNEIVLMRHGGLDTWNLSFASHAVVESLKYRNDLTYIFLNTPRFSDHPKIHFFDGTHDFLFVSQLLAASDAMLHARWEGETFGLACSEFLIRSKPIITWASSRERNHILMADKSIIMYNQLSDLIQLLCNLSTDFLNSQSTFIPLHHLTTYYSAEAVGHLLLDLLMH